MSIEIIDKRPQVIVTGISGPKGADGAQGEKGDQGDPGAQGPAGPNNVFLAYKAADYTHTLGTTIYYDPDLDFTAEANTWYKLDFAVIAVGQGTSHPMIVDLHMQGPTNHRAEGQGVNKSHTWITIDLVSFPISVNYAKDAIRAYFFTGWFFSGDGGLVRLGYATNTGTEQFFIRADTYVQYTKAS